MAEWRERAACRGRPKLKLATATSAPPLCGGCPVRVECLEDCLSFDRAPLPGIWGGTTPEDRKNPEWARHIAAHPVVPVRHNGPRHGTRAMYARGCRCGPCVAFEEEKQRQEAVRLRRAIHGLRSRATKESAA